MSTPNPRANMERRKAVFARLQNVYRAKLNGKFVVWEKRMESDPQTRNDPFIKLLRERYRKDHEAKLVQVERAVLRALGRVLQEHQVRVFSIGHADLFCFEDDFLVKPRNKTESGKANAWHRWPEAWAAARNLQIHAGAGNASQAQVKLGWWRNEMFGTYDNRGPIPVKIGHALKLFDHKDHKKIVGRFDFDSLREHLVACGVTPLE